MNHRRSTSVIVTITILGVSVCGSLSPSVHAAGIPSASQSDGSSPTYTPPSAALNGVTQAIEDAGAADPNFGGVSVDVIANTATIYRKDGNDSTIWPARYDNLATTTVPVRIEPALLSLSDKNAIDTLVAKYETELRENGIEITSWGLLDGYSSHYVITYTGNGVVPPQILSDLNRYGAGTVVFEKEAIYPADRTQDTSPYYGGDGIHSGEGVLKDGETIGVALCSDGMNLYNGSDYFGLTTEHCTAYNNDEEKMYAWWGPIGGQLMGTVTMHNPDHDAAFIDFSSNNHTGSAILWNGAHGLNSDFAGVQSLDRDPPVSGHEVCATGATSGAHCPAGTWGSGGLVHWSITGPFLDSETQDISGYRLRGFNSTDTIIATGDSGGAVYYFTGTGNGKVIGKGIISAIPGNAIHSCPDYVSQRPALNAQCGSAIFVVPLSIALSGHPNMVGAGF